MAKARRPDSTAETSAVTSIAGDSERPATVAWLRRTRERLGWSRRIVAEKLQVSPAAVRDYEAGEVAETISLRTLRRMAAALGCDVVIALVARDGAAASRRRDAAGVTRRPAKQPESPPPTIPWPDLSGDLEMYLK